MSPHPDRSPADRAAFLTAVERIKAAASIEAVVGARVPGLERRGRIAKARCPFHEERTPSFVVDPERGTWRCFGACGEGGDVISFVQRFDGLSFWDALTLLSEETGEPLPRRGDGGRSAQEEDRREALFDLLARAERFYRARLERDEGAAARAYLEGRGLTLETAQAFGCGWAPATGSPLVATASRKGVALDLLVEAGLVRRAEDGRPYDFFRNRLLVPIRDRLGRTVGFGGRVLPTDERGGPKYVNTAETALFKKSALVFGLDRAADAVRRRRELVLVEGYTDVMAAHQVGLTHVAAVLGTATTAQHAALVRRSGAERVVLVFDGDAAGGRASEKALGELLPLGLELRVVALPSGTDPCELLVGEGRAAFEAHLAGARDWFEWSLEGLADRSGPDLARGVDELLSAIARLASPVEQALRRGELAAALHVPPESVEAQWESWRRGRTPARSAASVLARGAARAARVEEEDPGEGAVDPREVAAFRSLVGALLCDNSLIPLYGELLERAPAGPVRRVLEALLRLYEEGDEEELLDAAAVVAALGDDPARELVLGMEIEASRADSPQALARDQELWLQRRDHERDLARLRARLERAERVSRDEEARAQVLMSLHAELKKRRVPSTDAQRASQNEP